jgi:23S rRNA-intervening sequence protein
MTANIAEGYGRFSYQENLQFCRQSRGSVYEIRDHLTTALDAAYITPEQYKQFDLQAISVIKLINGYLGHKAETTSVCHAKIGREGSPEATFSFLFSIFLLRLRRQQDKHLRLIVLHGTKKCVVIRGALCRKLSFEKVDVARNIDRI